MLNVNRTRRLTDTFGAMVLVFALLTAGSGTVSAQAQTDIAFVMDGSGSIDATDFALEKQGLQIAIQDVQLVPRDGTFGVTVVQFGGSRTRVEVPFTLINSSADVASIVAQITAIVQFRGNTNPGDGINAAMVVLNASGRPTASQNICVITDGLRNAGAPVGPAITNAKNSPIGLDLFGVMAIEDPPNFFQADFEAFYNPLVFGGGTVTTVSGAVEFANTVGPACFSPGVELVGIEVIQVIQDWSNSVQLVEGKRTFVRAHLKPADPAVADAVAVARLRGFRGGAEMAGSPLTALNPGGRIIAMQNPETRRDDWDASLNFELPAAWLNGTIELMLEGVGAGIICDMTAATDSDCRMPVTFNSTKVPEVKLVAIEWTDAGGTTHTPDDADLDELDARLLSIYPVNATDLSKGAMTWSGDVPPDLLEVLAELTTMRTLDGCDASCERIYYGVLEGFNGGGLAYRPGDVGTGIKPASNFSYGRNRHAHEIGHNLGRRHAPFCGATGDPFPYSATIGGQLVATLGPMDMGEDLTIWGFDSKRMTVVDPNETFEMMSYCCSRCAVGTRWRWISKFSYDAILTALDNRFLAAPPLVASGFGGYSSAATSSMTLFRGLIDLNADTADFLPTLTVDLSSPPSPAPGEYSLQLQDDAGGVLMDIPFEPEVFRKDFDDNGTDGEDPGVGFFLIPVPEDPNIKQAVVSRGGVPIAPLIIASSNAPTVNLIFPIGGESLPADRALFTWDSDDADGDPLRHTIQYSPDGGVNWQTLVVDWIGEAYDADLSVLPGSSTAMLRILASDGFLTGMAQSGAFSVPNHQPSVNIVSPAEGTEFTGVQSIILIANTRDVEDGAIPDSRVAWSSNVNGFLGNGNRLMVLASDLLPAIHAITVTAVDVGGLGTTDVVNIAVERIFVPPGFDFECLGLTSAKMKFPASPQPTFGVKDGGFHIKGSFIPDPSLIPLDPSQHDIEVGIGSYTQQFSMGSLIPKKGGKWEFKDEKGVATITKLKMKIMKDGSWMFEIKGRGIPRKDLLNGTLLTVNLAISDMTGSATAMLEQKKKELKFRGANLCDTSPSGPAATPMAEPEDRQLALASSPNPFNPTTTIIYTLPADGFVDLRIYDVMGRLVRTLVSDRKPAGVHRFVWDARDERGSNVASGIYFVRIEAAGEVRTRKLVFLK